MTGPSLHDDQPEQGRSDEITPHQTGGIIPKKDTRYWGEDGPDEITPVQPALFGAAQTHATKDDHYTPAWVFERMGITFDLDVCSPPSGVPWIPAARFLTVEDDGLLQPWSGRVWMNPPYSNCTPWVDKFIAHRHGIALLPHAKSLWHGRIWDAADALAQPPKRIIFVGADGDVSLPTFLAAFGEECVDAIARIGTTRRVA